MECVVGMLRRSAAARVAAHLLAQTTWATSLLVAGLATLPATTRAGVSPDAVGSSGAAASRAIVRATAGRPARGKLLVASPRLGDPNFARTVVLVLEYGAGGAVGVIINRRTDIAVDEVVRDVPELAGRPERIHFGGPVEPFRVLLLVHAREKPENSLELTDEIWVTGSIDALVEIIRARKDKAEFRLFAGYAGWGPGQLDAEIARGDWLIGDADPVTVFSKDPDGIWKGQLDRLGGQWVRVPEPPDVRPRPRRDTRYARCEGGELTP
jgi:putative transcriptional regulator